MFEIIGALVAFAAFAVGVAVGARGLHKPLTDKIKSVFKTGGGSGDPE